MHIALYIVKEILRGAGIALAVATIWIGSIAIGNIQQSIVVWVLVTCICPVSLYLGHRVLVRTKPK